MPDAVLAIDQGTTSVRATVLDGRLVPLASRAETVERSFPRPGWVDLDAVELVRATERVALAAIEASGCRPSEVVGLGLANQGETVVVWDRRTGEPIAPAIVWQCRRTEAECARLRADVASAASVRETTGLPIDAYFSATKIAWLLDSIPGARARAERGELCAGTLDAFTLFRLSEGRLFVTDPSTSCRTQLAALRDSGGGAGRFSDALCEVFRIPRTILPEVVASDAAVGPVRIGPSSIEVRAMLCDQPSALLGTGCLSPGDAKCTYGTGAFLQVNVGAVPPPVGDRDGDPPDGLLRSVAWEIDAETRFLVEGSVLAAGDVLTWLRDGLGMIGRPDEIEDVLARTPDAGGVAFLPALTGLGAPRWVGGARGTVLGLHRGTRREHLIRAALEGVAHQVADVLEIVVALRGGALAPMWADGGLSSSDAFLALQADLAGHTLRRAPSLEATTRGVGAVAAVRAGLAQSIAELCRVEPVHTVAPSMDRDVRSAARARHAQLVELAVSGAALSFS